MVPLEKVLEVKRMLDAGELSRRAIARETGVGRGTVNAIANGERGLFGAGDDLPEDTLPAYASSAMPTRCPGCGLLVHTPCVLCAARVARDARRATRRATRRAA